MSGDQGRRLILHMSVSLNGFVARVPGSVDWLTPSGEGAVDHGSQRQRLNLEMLWQLGLIVLGRTVYADGSVNQVLRPI